MRSARRARIRSWLARVPIRWQPPGIAFVVIAVPVLLSAWNTGTQLLYLIFAGVLSFLVISPLAGFINLRGLRTTAMAPDRTTRDAPFWVNLRIENHKRLPSGGLRLEASEAPGQVVGYIDRLPGREAALLNVEATVPRRGVHEVGRYDLVTRFPFGLFEQRRTVGTACEVLVHPRVRTLRTGLLDEWDTGSTARRVATGDGDEFFSLREYQPGDDLRLIAWRVSARTDKWMVREMTRDHAHSVVFALDNRCADAKDTETSEHFEEAVELCASLAISLVRQRYEVGVVLAETQIEAGLGKDHERRILDALARVQLTTTDDGTFDRAVSGFEARGATLVLLSHDPATWGQHRSGSDLSVLDPREVVYA